MKPTTRKSSALKNSPLPTRIFTYGCKPPSKEDQVLIREQLYLANRYYNALVEIEKTYLAECDQVYSQYGTYSVLKERHLAIQCKIDEAYKALGASRAGQTVETARDITKKDSPAIKALKKERKTVQDLLNEERKRIKKAHPECLNELKTVNKTKFEAQKAAYGSPDTPFWPTRLKINEAVEKAAGARFPRPPKFKPFTGEGRVVVQLQAGSEKTNEKTGKITPATIHWVSHLFDGTGTNIQIDPIPEGAYSKPRGERRRETRTQVRLRVATNPKGRTPIWVTLPVIMHRPLPADGVVKWAWLFCTKKGIWMNYELQITLEAASFIPTPSRNQKIISLDIGWLYEGEDLGRRVAYWADSDGKHGEILVPADVLQRIDYAKKLQSNNDRNLEDIRATLVAFRKSFPGLPEWFLEDTETAYLWRSPKKFLRLFSKWKENRFPGDEMMMGTFLTRWAKQNRHLYTWESCQRSRALGHRQEGFWLECTEIAKTYGTVVIEAFNLKELAKSVNPEDGLPSDGKEQRQGRVETAPGEFRSTLRLAVAKQGGQVVEVNMKNTTKVCHLCGHKDVWDSKLTRSHTCSECGATWDQDYNAAKNLLHIHLHGALKKAVA